MAGFKRVYNQFPGFNILGNIESVNTIDVPPPASPLGAGVGVTALIGEFEEGPLNTPTRVFGGSDLEANFGGFGFTKDGEPNVLPVAAKSAGADTSNYWDGNGFIALRNKRFAGLVIVRVDNSAGSVTFNRLACVVGSAAPYALTNGDTLTLSVDGAAAVTATFSGAVAAITGTAGTYPTGFVGGETLQVSIDGGATQIVTFTAADQTLAQVITRINSSTASTIAFDNGGQLELRSLLQGYSASIEVVGGTALSTFGLPAAPVQQVDTITINSNTGGGDFTLRTTVTVAGVATNFDGTYTAAGGDTTTQVRDNLLNALLALGVPGVTFAAGAGDTIVVTGDVNVPYTTSVQAEPAGGDMTIVNTTAVTLTLVRGTGNVARLDLVSGGEATSIISALAGVTADLTSDLRLRICATTTPATGSLLVSGVSTAAAALGLTTGTTVFANAGTASTIPAGTRLRDTANQTLWVTLQDIAVTATNGGPYTARVRPGVDDDTTPTAAAGTVTEILDTLPDGFAVTNASDLSRLTDTQMDTRYLDAIASTIDVSGVPYDINIMYSARTSERIMQAIRSNVLDATASGHRARKGIVSPPLNTSRSDAKGSSGVGVGNVGREQRISYIFPGLTTFVPEISAKGLAGGPGFTADGVIQTKADGFYASVASILPPEENRGQQLSDTNYGPLNALGLEDAYNKEQGGIGLTIDDYIDFKANGIVAPRTDRVAGMIFQSDVTSVNPATQPALVDAKRRFFGDFIIDSLSDIGVAYVKKLNTPARRRAFLSTINGFLEQLKSPNQPETSRLEDYRVVDDTTTEQRAQGFQIVSVAVRIFPSMDFIVFRTTVGTTVNVEEIGA
jgi:hypothetical protein